MKSKSVEHIAVAKMIAALLHGPQTAYDIQDVTGWHKNTVGHYIRALRREKAIYVAEWEQDRRGGWSLRAYMLGRKKDAPKPPVQSNVERCRRYKARLAQQALLQRMAGALPSSEAVSGNAC